MKSLWRIGLLAVAALLIGVAGQVQAGFVTTTLGAAGPGNFAIFSLGGTNLNMTNDTLNGPGTTTGNVGVASNGSIALNSSSPPAIIGNLYLGNGSNTNGSSSHLTNPPFADGQIQGSIFTNQDSFLGTGNSTGFWTGGTTTATGAVLDALNAANTFNNLAATTGPVITSSTVSGNTTTTWDFTGTGNTTNVVKITDLDVDDHNKLVLKGNAGQQIVIDISNSVDLHGSTFGGQVVLTGGLTSNDVVYNVTSTSTGDNVTSSGGSDSNGLPNATLNGILLDVAGGIGFAPGAVNGEIIGGGNEIRLVSGSQVNGSGGGQGTVPAPSSVILVLTGVVPLGIAAALRRRRQSIVLAA